jgi:hypothetical protein
LPEPIPGGEVTAHGRRAVFFIVRPDREQLGQIATSIDSGAVRPVIADAIPLAHSRRAGVLPVERRDLSRGRLTSTRCLA